MTSRKNPPQREKQPRRPLLRRADQACAGVILAVSLLAMGVYLFTHRGKDGLIDIDRAEPRQVQFQVDLNAAEWPELTLLPGVGETLARRIVESRQIDGPFADHTDLQRVRGIGPKTLDSVRPYLLPMPESSNVAGP